jgi:hypothetical protein
MPRTPEEIRARAKVLKAARQARREETRRHIRELREARKKSVRAYSTRAAPLTNPEKHWLVSRHCGPVPAAWRLTDAEENVERSRAIKRTIEAEVEEKRKAILAKLYAEADARDDWVKQHRKTRTCRLCRMHRSIIGRDWLPVWKLRFRGMPDNFFEMSAGICGACWCHITDYFRRRSARSDRGPEFFRALDRRIDADDLNYYLSRLVVRPPAWLVECWERAVTDRASLKMARWKERNNG